MLNSQLFQGRKALLPQLQRPGGDGQGQDVRSNGSITEIQYFQHYRLIFNNLQMLEILSL